MLMGPITLHIKEINTYQFTAVHVGPLVSQVHSMTELKSWEKPNGLILFSVLKFLYPVKRTIKDAMVVILGFPTNGFIEII